MSLLIPKHELRVLESEETSILKNPLAYSPPGQFTKNENAYRRAIKRYPCISNSFCNKLTNKTPNANEGNRHYQTRYRFLSFFFHYSIISTMISAHSKTRTSCSRIVRGNSYWNLSASRSVLNTPGIHVNS